MNFWSNYPFSRILLPFLFGIILEIYFPIFNDTHLYISLILLLLFSISTLTKLSRILKFKWIEGVLILLLFFSLGHNYVGFFSEVNSENHYSKHLGEEYKTTALISIREPVVEKKNSYQLKVDVLQLDSISQPTDGRMLVYVKKDSLSKLLSYGDTLFVHAKFSEIEEPKNPGQFNYKRYLRFHQIHHQVYVTEHDWKLHAKNQSFSLLSFANSLRQKMLLVLQQNNLEEDEFSVASALILGFRENLGEDLKLAYSSAGAMHVLAVSGLHVGIVYMVLNFLLQFMDRKRTLKTIKAILLLSIIWFYAFLTGLSPSVLRAATMFSFIIVGSAIGRNTNIYNTLCASAFFLLLYNPFLIMQVGFQLSYLAVLGIVYIQPKIYNMLYTRFYILDKIWAITSVSIAAQVATFPIGLLYFHQFPNYFILSNLVVIPSATLILGLGMAVLITSPIPMVSSLLGEILNYAIKGLNWSVVHIEKLPYSLTTGISISVLEVWLIYGFIVFFFAFIHYKKFRQLAVAFLCLIAFLIVDLREDQKLQDTQRVVFYSIGKTTAIDFIVGKEHYFLTDSVTFNNHSTMLFNVKHNWDDLDLDEPIFIETAQQEYKDQYFYRNKNFIQFLDKRILFIDDELKLKSLPEKIKLDVIVLANDANVKIQDLKQMFDFDQLIFDGSNSYKNIKTWTYFAKKEEVEFHFLSKEGAEILEISPDT